MPDNDETPDAGAVELEKKNADLTERLERLEAKQNDPAHIDALYRAHFGTPESKREEAKVDEDPKPAFEKLDTEGMSNDQIVQEMQRRQETLLDWQARQVDKKLSSRDREAANRENEATKAKEVDRIRSFSQSTNDFGEYKERIRDLYGATLDIESAYKFAKWEKLSKEAEASGRLRPAVRSTGADKDDKAKKTFGNVKDGATAAFDEVTQGVDLDSL